MPGKFYPKELKEEIIGKIKTEGITAVEAAKRYGIDVNNIYRWVSAGIAGARGNLFEINRLKRELADIDRKANILLDGYLDQIIDAETFKQKKNQFFEEKIKLQETIGKLETGGSLWIEPMREFIKTASECEKIARAKNNCEDVAIFAKRIGSNFFLSNRRLAAEFRQGFAAVSRARTARALPETSAASSICVGVTRLERATFRTPFGCASQLRHTPFSSGAKPSGFSPTIFPILCRALFNSRWARAR